MIRILANDGIDAAGKKIFTEAGFEIITEKVPQDNLIRELKNFDGILVRSATQVRKEHIDACNNLKLIGRAGVGLDNIDVAYAKDKGVHIVNTPEASSQSVAELVIASMFSMSRHLYDSHRSMPACDTREQFDLLKKKYSSGTELRGKTLGLIGFGKIGQAVARMALGLGMKVMPFKLRAMDIRIEMDLFRTPDNAPLTIQVKCVPFDDLISQSDYISLHVPFPKGSEPIIGAKELARMKPGVMVVNTARGGAISETDLLEALNRNHVSSVALDVFEGEPMIRKELREHPRVLLTPHIGGSTREAQERIGIELATKVVQLFKS